MGTDEIWEKATEALRHALEYGPRPTRSTRAAAPSTGPKIDIDVPRRHRPDLAAEHHPVRLQPPRALRGSSTWGPTTPGTGPIMIHRALFGSIERFFAILLEHYAGALPTWLAPEQVRVLGVRGRPPALRRPGGRSAPGHGARVAVDPADRASRRPDPPGQDGEDPLHPGGGGRRCRRRHRRRQPAGDRPPPNGGGAVDLHRGTRAARSPSGPVPKPRESRPPVGRVAERVRHRCRWRA